MLVKEFSGKNERDAINKALETLKLTEDQVRVEVVDKGKRSLLGFGEESPTVIRVYYEEISTSLSDFKTTVETILKYMGITAEVSVKEESETKIFINIQTEDSGVLIGKKGATLEALQFLISMMATKHIDDGNDIIEETETKRHIILDVDGYRDRREETLKHIARQSAATAKRTRRPISLDPMSPYERRVIHMELQEDPEIETRSEGEPPYRCVKIFPKRTAGENRTAGNYRNTGGSSPRRYNNNGGNRDRNYNTDKYGSGNY